ncbi:hypothetical protein, conserved [Eimeria brunetti]|uniref:Uncharacterized protein n=1 Tax=Eimeria brunetti TaxID=51314 RepID=U6LIL1_9EIME|nr:hypothetical protein, conserved [Eimeria brunetti]
MVRRDVSLEAIKVNSVSQHDALAPPSLAETEAQALQTIDLAISAADDDSNSSSSSSREVQRQMLKAIQPAISALLKSTAASIRPQLKDECSRIVVELAKHSEDQQADADVDEMDDFSFSELQQQHQEQQQLQQQQQVQEQQQQQQQQQVQFWEGLKRHLGALTEFASPLIKVAVEKLNPLIQKVGAKAAPVFARYIRELLREACEEAEEKAGVQ